MLKEDFVIQSDIRRILVRSNIDYSRIAFGTVKGVVYIRGVFEMSRSYTDGVRRGHPRIHRRRPFIHWKRRSGVFPELSDVIFQVPQLEKRKRTMDSRSKKRRRKEDDLRRRGIHSIAKF